MGIVLRSFSGALDVALAVLPLANALGGAGDGGHEEAGGAQRQQTHVEAQSHRASGHRRLDAGHYLKQRKIRSKSC